MTDDPRNRAGIKKEAPKRSRGQPTAYRPQYAAQAEKLCRLGATNADLADFFKVSTQSILRWSAAHEDFCNALKAKDFADDKVERALYQRAVGYSYDAEKIFQHQGKVIRAKVREHVPPDVTACIFWLKNRRKEQWRDKHEVEQHTTHSFEAIILRSLTLQPMTPAQFEAKAREIAGTKKSGWD